MKIYFEDDKLIDATQVPLDFFIRIDAAEGPRENKQDLEYAMEYHPKTPIYTNSLIALSNEYAWNEELGVPEIYIRAGEHMHFHRIDELTERELRFAHNICKMYLAGSFDTHIEEK